MYKGIIGVAYHKDFFVYQNDLFRPINVGANEFQIEMSCIRDNEGDNISYKHDYYSELTATYWLWKNVDVDFYGVMHYRRYLVNEKPLIDSINYLLYKLKRGYKVRILPDVAKKHALYYIETQSTSRIVDAIEDYTNSIYEEMNVYDIILPKKMWFRKSVYEQYNECHIIGHLDTLLEIVKCKYPDVFPYCNRLIREANYMYGLNMFTMKKKFFNLYCDFVFSVLEELEGKIKLPIETAQLRVCGFLAERLMAPFIEYLTCEYGVKIKEKNVLLVDM